MSLSIRACLGGLTGRLGPYDAGEMTGFRVSTKVYSVKAKDGPDLVEPISNE